MLDEAQFHRLADATIGDFSDKILDADTDACLECDIIGGVLTIESESGRSWVVSKHAPTRQLWLASPVSGGLHFPFVEGSWVLADGRMLPALLAAELAAHAGVKVEL